MENFLDNWIHINSIKIRNKDTMPLNPKTMSLAIKLWNKEIQPDDLPPIKIQQDKYGNNWVKDGRHRYLAFRLCGLTHIKSIVSQPKKLK